METTFYKETTRLRAVSERPGEDGRYRLEAFGNEALDADFDRDDLDRMLEAVAEKVHGTRRVYRLEDHDDFDEYGNFVFETAGGRVTVRDIRDNIDGIGDDPDCFLVFVSETRQPRWIVSQLVELECRGFRTRRR